MESDLGELVSRVSLLLQLETAGISVSTAKHLTD